MSDFSSLSNDPEFKQRWPYVWSKLEPELLKMQRDYASKYRGKYEQIGMYVEFMSELMDALNVIDIDVQAPTKTPRPRLHNRDFGQK